MLYERDEFGFFEKVITIHPYTKKTRKIELDKKNIIFEFSNDFFPFSKYFFVRIFQRIFYFPRVLYHIIKIIKSEKIDIIRATDPYIIGFYALLASIITKIPFCISIHSDYFQRHKLDKIFGSPKIIGSRILAELLEKFVIKNTDLLLPIRETLAENYCKLGVNPNKIHIIPHGIDLSIFLTHPKNYLRKKYQIPPSKKIISFVGRITRENYIYDIILIAEKILQVRKDVIFVIAGEGVEFENLKNEINGNELQKQFLLIGFISNNDASELRKISYINLCLMGGYSLIEACAAGRPVISYDVEWHSELVRNKETGFLVQEGKIDTVAESILYLLKNPNIANKLGKNAKRLALKNHDIHKTSAIKVSVYKELLEKC